jgi:hypothetical protein
VSKRVADDVVEVVLAEAAPFGVAVGMDEDRHIEVDRTREEGIEPSLLQLGAGDVGKDEHTLHPELCDRAEELVGGRFGRLQRHPGERDQALLPVTGRRSRR